MHQKRPDDSDPAIVVVQRAVLQGAIDGTALRIRADLDAGMLRGTDRNGVPALARGGDLARDLGAFVAAYAEKCVRPIEADRLCQCRNGIHKRVVDGNDKAGRLADVSAALQP